MIRLAMMFGLFLMLSIDASASPTVVQSLVVEFPSNGRVIVQARLEMGKFPSMLFIAEKTGKVLLHSSIRDEERWLVAVKDGLAPPDLGFRVIRSTSLVSPLIMSVGVRHGGSDNSFYLTLFGEVQGELKRLNQQPVVANIQGGYYLGHLNDKLGFGLVAWNFIWDLDSEAHYGKHRYEARVYNLKDDRLKLIFRRVSRKKYGASGSISLREIGINVVDQRRGIPVIRSTLE